MKIQQTTDYARFRSIISNREVDKKHVRKLADSIARKNLLHIRPVICNHEMQVIDGQHRVAACQLLKQPVWFIQVDDLTKDDIALLNTAQKNWCMLDFINFYTIEGREDFRKFSQLLNRFSEMKVTILLRLCGTSRNVRGGQIDISNIKQAERVCIWVRQLRNKGENLAFVHERNFVRAVAATVEVEEEFDRLLSRATELTKAYSEPEYKKQIKAIIR
ncbi:MAG: ParB N-terminal domain-containing protein [Cyclobacteriaceae bacterium]|jgi:hypothetical protein